jgi:hypothetical protein
MKGERQMTKKELMATILGIIGIISICFATFFWMENRYACAGDMVKAMETIKKVADRLDQKMLVDQLGETQKRIYTIEDRYCPDKSKPCTEDKMPQTVREEYRRLLKERTDLQKEIDTFKPAKK